MQNLEAVLQENMHQVTERIGYLERQHGPNYPSIQSLRRQLEGFESAYQNVRRDRLMDAAALAAIPAMLNDETDIEAAAERCWLFAIHFAAAEEKALAKFCSMAESLDEDESVLSSPHVPLTDPDAHL